MIGSIPHNYHFHYVLTTFISQDTYNYDEEMTPKLVGGYVLRKSYTEEELYKTIGFGFHLIIPKPHWKGSNAECLK